MHVDMYVTIFGRGDLRRQVPAIALPRRGAHALDAGVPAPLLIYGLYTHALHSHGPCSYGLYSFGLYSYDLNSYGLNSYGL